MLRKSKSEPGRRVSTLSSEVVNRIIINDTFGNNKTPFLKNVTDSGDQHKIQNKSYVGPPTQQHDEKYLDQDWTTTVASNGVNRIRIIKARPSIAAEFQPSSNEDQLWATRFDPVGYQKPTPLELRSKTGTHATNAGRRIMTYSFTYEEGPPAKMTQSNKGAVNSKAISNEPVVIPLWENTGNELFQPPSLESVRLTAIASKAVKAVLLYKKTEHLPKREEMDPKRRDLYPSVLPPGKQDESESTTEFDTETCTRTTPVASRTVNDDPKFAKITCQTASDLHVQDRDNPPKSTNTPLVVSLWNQNKDERPLSDSTCTLLSVPTASTVVNEVQKKSMPKCTEDPVPPQQIGNAQKQGSGPPAKNSKGPVVASFGQGNKNKTPPKSSMDTLPSTSIHCKPFKNVLQFKKRRTPAPTKVGAPPPNDHDPHKQDPPTGKVQEPFDVPPVKESIVEAAPDSNMNASWLTPITSTTDNNVPSYKKIPLSKSATDPKIEEPAPLIVLHRQETKTLNDLQGSLSETVQRLIPIDSNGNCNVTLNHTEETASKTTEGPPMQDCKPDAVVSKTSDDNNSVPQQESEITIRLTPTMVSASGKAVNLERIFKKNSHEKIQAPVPEQISYQTKHIPNRYLESISSTETRLTSITSQENKEPKCEEKLQDQNNNIIDNELPPVPPETPIPPLEKNQPESGESSSAGPLYEDIAITPTTVPPATTTSKTTFTESKTKYIEPMGKQIEMIPGITTGNPDVSTATTALSSPGQKLPSNPSEQTAVETMPPVLNRPQTVTILSPTFLNKTVPLSGTTMTSSGNSQMAASIDTSVTAVETTSITLPHISSSPLNDTVVNSRISENGSKLMVQTTRHHTSVFPSPSSSVLNPTSSYPVYLQRYNKNVPAENTIDKVAAPRAPETKRTTRASAAGRQYNKISTMPTIGYSNVIAPVCRQKTPPKGSYRTEDIMTSPVKAKVATPTFLTEGRAVMTAQVIYKSPHAFTTTPKATALTRSRIPRSRTGGDVKAVFIGRSEDKLAKLVLPPAKETRTLRSEGTQRPTARMTPSPCAPQHKGTVRYGAANKSICQVKPKNVSPLQVKSLVSGLQKDGGEGDMRRPLMVRRVRPDTDLEIDEAHGISGYHFECLPCPLHITEYQDAYRPPPCQQKRIKRRRNYRVPQWNKTGCNTAEPHQDSWQTIEAKLKALDELENFTSDDRALWPLNDKVRERYKAQRNIQRANGNCKGFFGGEGNTCKNMCRTGGKQTVFVKGSQLELLENESLASEI